jgi:hypothetical protein
MFACVDGRGRKGEGAGKARGQKWGNWLWALDKQGQNFASSYKEQAFQIKRVIFTFVNTTNMHFNIIYACYTLNLKIQNPLSSSLKINHVMENWNMHLFLAHWTERLQTLHTVSHEFSINISSIATWLCTVSPTSVSFFRWKSLP